MENNDTIDLRKYLSAIKKGWYWYVITFAVFTALAITYHFVRMDQYAVHSSLLIEDDDGESGGAMGGLSSGMQSMIRTFSIGGLGSSSIDNEIEIFHTHNTMVKLIKRLQLNRVYVERRGLKKYNLYQTSPVIVDIPEAVLDTLERGFKVLIDLHSDATADIKIVRGFFSSTIAEKKGATLPTLLETEFGPVQVLKSEKYSPSAERSIKVMVSGNDATVEALAKTISIDYLSKKSDGVELAIKANTRQLGKDILNTIMAIYNDTRVERKNDRASQAVEFYDKMIADLSSQLGDSERRIEEFKRKNNIIDFATQAEITLKADQAYGQNLVGCINQDKIYDIIINTISDPNRKYEMIPVSVGNEKTSAVLEQYNELIMNRMQLGQSARENNPSYSLLTEQIDAMRISLLESVKRSKADNLIFIETLKSEKYKYDSQINKMPGYEREYYDMMRDKELKNELYLFLLGKRYDNAMTLASNFPRGFMIEPAYSEVQPLLTKSVIALGLAVVITILVPTFFLVLVVILRKDNKTETIEE